MKAFTLTLALSAASLLLANSLTSDKSPEANSKFTPQILKATQNLVITEPSAQRKLLVFSQTNGYSHKSIPTGKAAFSILGKETGAFETIISNDLSYFEPENIAQFDAICFLNTTGEVFLPKKKRKKKGDTSVSPELTKEEELKLQERSDRLKESLMMHIKSGKGFIGIHSATDTFYKWPEYGEMIGAYFNGHPWTSKMDVSLKVSEAYVNDPLVAHLKGENLEFKEEIYEFKEAEVGGNAEVLIKLDPELNSFANAKRKDSKNVPISWTKMHGKGRVFYCSLGHNDEIFYNEKVLQHFLAGVQWAMGDLKK
ncbi:ThuA domain-containing protein [Akkermansiaceae bacterium]|nr:ThuA domain-containing protein [Akkermansiaceae bacterium]